MQTKFKFLVFLIAACATAYSGCFLWTPVKDEWQDFTAYFNTYYNGEHAFDEAMLDVKSSLKEYNISLLSGQQTTPFVISSNAKQDFDIAIEKASKVLQFYPNSGYTEDCLFMIGIGYYYEADNIRAGRKFIEEQSKYPDSRRFCEAQMYYGEIEVKNRNYRDGYDDLLKALVQAEKQDNSDVAAGTAGDLAEYFLMQTDTVTAAAYLDTAAAFSKNDEAAVYSCKAGDLFESLGNLKDARREYEAAWGDARDIRLRFYSRYFLARAERRNKQFYSSLSDLKYLRSDDKYFQYFPLIEYQRTEALYDSGEVSSAFSEFQRIDTAYSASEAATRSAFRLANMYLYKVGDYQNALKYYQKAASHVAVPVISERSRQMSTTLQEYSVDAYKLHLADSMYQRALSAASRNDSTIKHSQDEIDTLYEHAALAQQVLGGFFLFRLQFSDSAISHYLAIVSQFSKSKVYPSALYTLGEYYFSSGDTANAKNYLIKLINELPESGYTVSARSLLGMEQTVFEDSSQAGYDRAMNLENGNFHDSAVAVLKGLLKGKKSSLAPQILYAIGWIYENDLNVSDSAFVYYKKLATQYPVSDYSANVNPTIAGYEQAQRDSALARKHVEDSIANVSKSIASDSAKESALTRPHLKTASEDSTNQRGRTMDAGQFPKPDSLEAVRPSKPVTDSVALRRRQIGK
ncbi:MAG TPA: tetratricopeptide repeat protein [Candidatus Acidoferrales bacterium]|nr:tetratricopeptide repeat protein [Candidatus Acidoferrales bacterium]